jgi:DNA-binding winged helix-turn-helix (wHTH) protein
MVSRYPLSTSVQLDAIVTLLSALKSIVVPEFAPPAVIAYGDAEEIESAFVLGAIEYLTDPWSPIELRARLRRVLNADRIFSIIDGTTYRNLTPRMRATWDLLARHTGRIVDRATIGARIGVPSTALQRGSRAVDMVVSRLRRVLAPRGVEIETIRGIGYRLYVDNRWIKGEFHDAENELFRPQNETPRFLSVERPNKIV